MKTIILLLTLFLTGCDKPISPTITPWRVTDPLVHCRSGSFRVEAYGDQTRFVVLGGTATTEDFQDYQHRPHTNFPNLRAIIKTNGVLRSVDVDSLITGDLLAPALFQQLACTNIIIYAEAEKNPLAGIDPKQFIVLRDQCLGVEIARAWLEDGRWRVMVPIESLGR